MMSYAIIAFFNWVILHDSEVHEWLVFSLVQVFTLKLIRYETLLPYL